LGSYCPSEVVIFSGCVLTISQVSGIALCYVQTSVLDQKTKPSKMQYVHCLLFTAGIAETLERCYPSDCAQLQSIDNVSFIVEVDSSVAGQLEPICIVEVDNTVHEVVLQRDISVMKGGTVVGGNFTSYRVVLESVESTCVTLSRADIALCYVQTSVVDQKTKPSKMQYVRCLLFTVGIAETLERCYPSDCAQLQSIDNVSFIVEVDSSVAGQLEPICIVEVDNIAHEVVLQRDISVMKGGTVVAGNFTSYRVVLESIESTCVTLSRADISDNNLVVSGDSDSSCALLGAVGKLEVSWSDEAIIRLPGWFLVIMVSVMNNTYIHLRIKCSNIYMYRRERIYKKLLGEIQ
jgi:hypothetical protein